MTDRRMLAAALATVALLAVAGGTGCRRVPIDSVDRPFGEAATVSGMRSDKIALEDAESLTADIEMGAGELSVDGDAEPGDAMDADYRYSRRAWVPQTEYRVDGGQGRLRVTQDDVGVPDFGGGSRNEWDMSLPSQVPLDLHVVIGAGESTLDLAGTELRSLRLEVGAGESTVDLSGAWDHDVEADIQAGVGALKLVVPRDVGVRIWGRDEGLGDYVVDSAFHREGEYYVNDAWDTADVRMDLKLQRGLGEVRVQTAP